MGHQHKDHKGQLSSRHYANHPVPFLMTFATEPNFNQEKAVIGGIYNFKLPKGSFEALTSKENYGLTIKIIKTNTSKQTLKDRTET